MNARQIEIFHAVMRMRSVTGAAAFLGVSQPAVSKALRLAERQTGFRLFHTVKGRLLPTPEAQRLLPDAERIVNEVAAFARLTGEVRSGGAGLVRVAASSSLSITLVPRAVAAFERRHPMVRMASHLLPARETADAVLSGQADLGLCLSPVPKPGLAVRTLPGPRMILIAPEGHPVLRRRVVQPADVAPHPLVSYGSDTYFGQVLDQAFASAGFSRDVALQITMSMSAVCHVLAGAGVAIVDGFIRHIGLPGVGWRPFAPSIMLPVTLMTPDGRALPQLATAFIQTLMAELEEMAA
ncbi:LysR family transcriptional regulator [Muricoccus nepalensis]|nr:LysR family transcriptional regulator [Roseomonas nepalensis]